MRIFGIDPGSERTGYGCVETDGRRHHLVAFGAISAPAASSLPERLVTIHRELTAQVRAAQPDCIAIENIFHAANARSALKLGHARGVAMLVAGQSGCMVAEYTPAEIKRAVVGYGRAEKQQVQQMVKLLLGLDVAPSPHDAADALAVAICHLHTMPLLGRLKPAPTSAGDSPVPTTAGDAPARTSAGDSPASRRADVGAGLSRPAKSWRNYRLPARG